MGFPASGVEGMFRNSVVEVAQFLLEKHQDRFMIYNLSERTYDYSLFHDQVMHLPLWKSFFDSRRFSTLVSPIITTPLFYSCSPSSSLSTRGSVQIPRTLWQCIAWYASFPRPLPHISLQAGKGRTGTIIACYLIYAGLVSGPTEALEYYASQRSHINKGVTRPSQKRFAPYRYGLPPLTFTVVVMFNTSTTYAVG